MAEARKSFLLRIPPSLWDQVARLAQQELRSTNAQIEFLLRDALRRRGAAPHDEGKGSDTGPDRRD